MELRKAGLKDLDTIVSMQQALASESAIWGYRSDSVEAWNGRNLDWLFLAVDNDESIGFIYCAERPYRGESVFPEGSRILEIVELYVRPEARHGGSGRQIVKIITSKANIEGFSHLRLYSAAKRFDDILAFYRECGFKPWYLEMIRPIGVEEDDALGP